jgi:Flp pilus assembly protein CpaB
MESKHLQTIAHALVLVAVMLGLIAAALWFRLEPSAFQNQAQAQSTARVMSASQDGGIPDAGKQRQLQLELLQAISQRLADIEKGLRDGSFSIQATGQSKKGAPKESEQ